MNIHLGDLAPGACRNVTPKERERLMQMLEASSNDMEEIHDIILFPFLCRTDNSPRLIDRQQNMLRRSICQPALKINRIPRKYPVSVLTVVMSYAEGWTKVTWNGQTGFVKTEYLK